MSTIKRIRDAFVARAVEQHVKHAPIEVVQKYARRTVTIDASRKGRDPSRVGIKASAPIEVVRKLAVHSVLQGHFKDGVDADARAFDKAHRSDMMGGAWADRGTSGGLKRQKVKAKDYSHVTNRVIASQDVYLHAASRKLANARKCVRLHEEATNAEDRREVKRLARAMRHNGNL